MKLTTFALTALIAALMLAGCSYQPARINPEPIIEIGDGGHHDGHSGGGGFCPPGQAKKGRC
ncbi:MULTISPECIES: hypothetical protein [Halomonadaceae]|uniref:Lipoprotein n=1 Tax=Onishia taeanensis TaxID=284577 RepID=A0A328XP19_9GAMM|nr:MULTISPECIES: hypothetical protein [Halomonas]RAR61553.1 hypothetical protein BCL93_105154 [Halomonas taeanensis]